MPDLYRILQIDPSAEPEVIEAVYRRLARKYHPDVNPSVDANRQMQEINMAYEILGDPARRLEYDRNHRLGGNTYRESSYGQARTARPGRPRKRWHAADDAPPRPRLVAYPEILEVGSMPRGVQRAASFRVEMTQGRNIRGRVWANQSWIKVTSPKTLHDLNEAVVEFVVDTTHLRDGVSHFGSVSIDSLAYGSLTVPVVVYIEAEPKPHLHVEPKLIKFDAVKGDTSKVVGSVRLWDEAGLSMEGSLHVKPSWLQTDVVDFANVSELNVGLTADVSNLRVGQTYSGRIEIHSSNGRGTIVVKATVLPEVKPLPDSNDNGQWVEFLSQLEASTEWEQSFLHTVTLQAKQKGWKPSKNQKAVLESIWRRCVEKSY